jgi:hypothetical protein
MPDLRAAAILLEIGGMMAGKRSQLCTDAVEVSVVGRYRGRGLLAARTRQRGVEITARWTARLPGGLMACLEVILLGSERELLENGPEWAAAVLTDLASNIRASAVQSRTRQ